MYDRSLDFIPFEPLYISRAGIPKHEVCFFYDSEYQSWIYEFIDNESFDLKQLHGDGRVIRSIDLPYDWNIEDVFCYFEDRFKEAKIYWYSCKEDWIQDYELGCNK